MANKSIGMMAEERDWRAENDLRCLMDCEKIEKDPKRLKAARELAKKQLLDLAAVASETE